MVPLVIDKPGLCPCPLRLPAASVPWQRPSPADVVPGQSDSSFAERRSSIGHQVTANDARSRVTEGVRWLNTRYSFPKSRHIAPAKPTSARFLLVRFWTVNPFLRVTRHPHGTTLPPRAWDHLVPHSCRPTVMLADQRGGVNRWASGGPGEDRPRVALAPPEASGVCGRTRPR